MKVGPNFFSSVVRPIPLFLFSVFHLTLHLAPSLNIPGYWFTLQMHALCIVSTRLKFTPYFSPFTTYISCPIHVNCLANNDTFSSLSRSYRDVPKLPLVVSAHRIFLLRFPSLITKVCQIILITSLILFSVTTLANMSCVSSANVNNF